MAVAEAKKDLARTFDLLVDQFKRESTNGSIELHFANGLLAKIHERKVH